MHGSDHSSIKSKTDLADVQNYTQNHHKNLQISLERYVLIGEECALGMLVW
jgi:hypothetical protein